MPRVNIEGVGSVNFPDTMAPEDIRTAIERDILSQARGRTAQSSQITGADPTGSTLDNFLAGAGKAMVDTGRGIAQITSLNGRLPWGMTPAEYSEVQKRDAPLMATGGGLAGNLTGNLAMMIGPGALAGAVGKGAALPGLVDAVGAAMAPKTALGALAQGIVMGGAQPVGTQDSRAANAALGGVVSAALPAVVAAGSGVKSLVQPFTENGREAIAGRVLQRFATDPASIERAATTGLVPGSRPLLSEATQDVGLSTLEQSLRNNPEAKALIVGRDMANNAARVGAVRDIAGDAGKREALDTARRLTANDLYGKALNNPPADTIAITEQINELMKRPTFAQAWRDAANVAKDAGAELAPIPELTIKRSAESRLVNPNEDDIITAIRKLGGITPKDESIGSLAKQMPFSPDPRFGPVWRQSESRGSTGTVAGHSPDRMAELLYEKGYLASRDDLPMLMSKIEDAAVSDKPHYSLYHDQASGDPLVDALTKLTKQFEIKNLPKAPAPELDPVNLARQSHYAKLALDSKIESLADNPTAQLNAIAIKDKLVALMESKDFAPAYRAARTTYAEMSKPINQMDVGQELLDKLTPALADYGSNTRIKSEAFAKALRDADQTAKRATGFGGATLGNIMSPEQMGTLGSVAKELAMRANASDMGLGRGSATAQNLVSQDVLRQVLGPLGLPQSWAESVIPLTAMRPLDWAAKLPEQKIMQALANAATDPAIAKAFLARSASPSSLSRGIDAFVPPAVTMADLMALTAHKSAQ
jgi:hypothetical protein